MNERESLKKLRPLTVQDYLFTIPGKVFREAGLTVAEIWELKYGLWK